MPEIIPSVPERTVVVNPNRYGLLTVLSLVFNGLFLLLLLIGLISHHHQKVHRENFGHNRDGHEGGDRDRGGMRFHHHERCGMRHGWGRGPEFGRGEDRGRDRDSSADDEGGRGRSPGGDEDRPGGPGGFGGGRQGQGFGGAAGMKQGPPTAAELTGHIMKHLGTQLALTDQENTQIRPVIEAQVAQIEKDMDAQRQARLKSIDDTTTKIRSMLTVDQQKKLDEMKSAEDQKMDQAKPVEPTPAAEQTKPKT